MAAAVCSVPSPAHLGSQHPPTTYCWGQDQEGLFKHLLAVLKCSIVSGIAESELGFCRDFARASGMDRNSQMVQTKFFCQPWLMVMVGTTSSL